VVEHFHDGKASPSPQPTSRTTLTLVEARANIGDLSDEVFQIQWPEGSVVDDRITGTVIWTGPEPSRLYDILDQQAADAVAAVAAGPPIAGGSNESHASGRAEALGERPTRGSFLLPVTAMLAATVVIVLLALWLVRRRQDRTRILVACLCASSVCSEARAGILEHAGVGKFMNCGLNATAFSLRYLGYEADISSLARELGVGEHFQHETNLSDIKGVLLARGLTVEGFRQIVAEDVLDRLARKSEICILHMARSHGREGHFYVVVKRQGGQVYVVDPGAGAKWTTAGEFRTVFERRSSGLCLFVSQQQKSRPPTTCHDLAQERIVYDLGTVHPGMGDVVVEIPVVNTFSDGIQIGRWAGTCNCVKKVELRPATEDGSVMAAGHKGTLLVVFDRTSLGRGEVIRSVAVRLKHGSEHTLMLEMTAHVLSETGEAGYSWVPSTIDFGVFFSASVLESPVDIMLYLPSDTRIRRVWTSSPEVAVLSRSPAEVSVTSSRARTVYRYEVRIVRKEPGEFREHMYLDTDVKDMPTIIIPVVGRYVPRQGP